jgi:hypothetical protein
LLDVIYNLTKLKAETVIMAHPLGYAFIDIDLKGQTTLGRKLASTFKRTSVKKYFYCFCNEISQIELEMRHRTPGSCSPTGSAAVGAHLE